MKDRFLIALLEIYLSTVLFSKLCSSVRNPVYRESLSYKVYTVISQPIPQKLKKQEVYQIAMSFLCAFYVIYVFILASYVVSRIELKKRSMRKTVKVLAQSYYSDVQFLTDFAGIEWVF